MTANHENPRLCKLFNRLLNGSSVATLVSMAGMVASGITAVVQSPAQSDPALIAMVCCFGAYVASLATMVGATIAVGITEPPRPRTGSGGTSSSNAALLASTIAMNTTISNMPHI